MISIKEIKRLFWLKKKIIFLFLIIAIISVVVGFKLFLAKPADNYSTALVTRQNIKEEISSTGQVKKGNEINLGFKNNGLVEEIKVIKGQNVEKGELLAKLNSSQAQAQFSKAQAGLNLAEAELAKILAGSTKEEIALEEAQLETAKNNLIASQKDLENDKSSAEDSLKEVYEDARTALSDGYLKAYNSFNAVDLIRRTYFTGNDFESIDVTDNRAKMEQAVTSINVSVLKAQSTLEDEDTDTALSLTGTKLFEISQALEEIRADCESLNYKGQVSSADKTILDNHRGYINTVLTSITSAKQAVISIKTDNETNITSAENEVIACQDALLEAEKNLAVTKAGPSEENIALYQAKVNQAQADVAYYSSQIADSKIFAPVKGMVVKIDMEVGELIQAGTGSAAIILMPDAPFEVELDISETEIRKVSLSNSCSIALDAFPREEFKGEVMEIDPSETIIQGVVYYKVMVSLQSEDIRIKPGMTANVSIITANRENVLAIPQRAVSEKDNQQTVKVLIDHKIEERIIKTGIKDIDGMMEITDGLQEGEEVITFIKSD